MLAIIVSEKLKLRTGIFLFWMRGIVLIDWQRAASAGRSGRSWRKEELEGRRGTERGGAVWGAESGTLRECCSGAVNCGGL